MLCSFPGCERDVAAWVKEEFSLRSPGLASPRGSREPDGEGTVPPAETAEASGNVAYPALGGGAVMHPGSDLQSSHNPGRENGLRSVNRCSLLKEKV